MNTKRQVCTVVCSTIVLANTCLSTGYSTARLTEPDQAQPKPAPAGLGGPPQSPQAATPDAAKKLKAASGASESSALTLVERDLAGKVRRLEISLESAALQKLTRAYSLTKTDIVPAEQVIARRAAKIDAFVENNIDLLTKMGNAFAGTDKIDQAQLLLEATGKLQSSLLESPMEQQVQDALPKQYQKPFNQLVRTYWDAVAEERLSDPATNKNAEGKPESRMALLGQERAAALGKQIELSLQRSLKSGSLAYTYLMKGITVTSEQEPKLREFFAAHAEAANGDATDEQNKKLFWQVYSVLDAQQQAIALKNVSALSGNVPKRKAAKPSGKQ